MNSQAPQVEVVVENGTSEEDQAAIRQVLDNHGIRAGISTTEPDNLEHGVSAGVTRFNPGIEGSYGSGHLWSMRIHGRINEIAGSCGATNLRDAADEVRRLRAKQTGTSPAEGIIMLVDEETGIRVDLKFQLPLTAYEDLKAIRFSTFESDPISFHHKSGRNGRWRSPR